MLGNKELGAAGQLEHPTADYEYSTLMRLMGVSVSKHLMDDHFTCIWANDNFYDLIGYSKEEFESRFHNRPDEYFCGNPKGWHLLEQSVRDS